MNKRISLQNIDYRNYAGHKKFTDKVIRRSQRMLTLERYGRLTPREKRNVLKKDLEKLIDDQLALLNNDPNEIRNVITNAINEAIDKKFEQISNELSEESKRISEENVILRKVITEQQKCLERLCNDKNKSNVFKSGIPVQLKTENGILNNPETIIKYIITSVAHGVNNNDYKIMKTFQPREGHTQHSTKLFFTSDESKRHVMQRSKKIK